MRFLWIPAALLTSGVLAVIGLRVLRRRTHPDIEPVTKEWLAQAASREDHVW